MTPHPRKNKGSAFNSSDDDVRSVAYKFLMCATQESLSEAEKDIEFFTVSSENNQRRLMKTNDDDDLLDDALIRKKVKQIIKDDAEPIDTNYFVYGKNAIGVFRKTMFSKENVDVVVEDWDGRNEDMKTKTSKVVVKKYTFDQVCYSPRQFYDAFRRVALKRAVISESTAVLCFGMAGSGKSLTTEIVVANHANDLLKSEDIEKVEIGGIEYHSSGTYDLCSGKGEKTEDNSAHGKKAKKAKMELKKNELANTRSVQTMTFIVVENEDDILGAIRTIKNQRESRNRIEDGMGAYASRSTVSVRVRAKPKNRKSTCTYFIDLAHEESLTHSQHAYYVGQYGEVFMQENKHINQGNVRLHQFCRDSLKSGELVRMTSSDSNYCLAFEDMLQHTKGVTYTAAFIRRNSEQDREKILKKETILKNANAITGTIELNIKDAQKKRDEAEDEATSGGQGEATEGEMCAKGSEDEANVEATNGGKGEGTEGKMCAEGSGDEANDEAAHGGEQGESTEGKMCAEEPSVEFQVDAASESNVQPSHSERDALVNDIEEQLHANNDAGNARTSNVVVDWGDIKLNAEEILILIDKINQAVGQCVELLAPEVVNSVRSYSPSFILSRIWHEHEVKIRASLERTMKKRAESGTSGETVEDRDLLHLLLRPVWDVIQREVSNTLRI